MHRHNSHPPNFFVLVLISALLAACGNNTSDSTISIEQAVEQTMEAIETGQSAAEQPATEQPAAASYPLPEICDPIAALLSQHLIGVTISTGAENFNDEASGLVGEGCTVLAEGDGTTVTDWGQTNSNFMMAMQATGWQMDPNFSGGGAGGLLETYRLGGYVCRYITEVRPSDMSLCDPNQPLPVCLDAIAPEQRLYAVTVSCSIDTSPPAVAEPEPIRVEFPVGSISTSIPGALAPQGVVRFVLGAMAGQQMTVNLATEPADSAILIIWGADGTVLISDHAEASNFIGILPSPQDYYVNIRSVSQQAISYTVEFIIPALDSTNAGEQAFYPRPLVVPVEFEPALPTLTGTGVPVILPDTSLMAAGQLTIYPYILTSRAGLYEISLDYTSDCQGAGACHFGSLAGMWVGPDATTVTSTDSFIYEADRAVAVQLDKGIIGYFVEGLCGANCDDSKIFWLFEGYQFMVGGKAADQSGLVDLANAFINNSIR